MNYDTAFKEKEVQSNNNEVLTQTPQSMQPDVKNSNSRKYLIIGCVVFGVIAICLASIALIIAVALPALGVGTFLNFSQQSNNTSIATDEPSNISENTQDEENDNSSGSNTSEDEDFNITTGQNGQLPKDFPSDIPVYSQENITAISSNESSIISYVSKASGQELFDRYKKELVSNGWQIGNEGSFSSLYTLTATKNGNREITIVVSDLEDLGTSVAIEYN